MSEELREALDGARAREAGAYDGDRSGLASGLPGVGVADRFESSGEEEAESGRLN
jgi:hypothetical protein